MSISENLARVQDESTTLLQIVPLIPKMIPIRESSGHVSFSVKVQPRARKNAITGALGDALKVSITAPPVDGKANQAVIEFFADILDVPRTSITIAGGETSRVKVIRVAGATKAAVEQRLAEAAGI